MDNRQSIVAQGSFDEAWPNLAEIVMSSFQCGCQAEGDSTTYQGTMFVTMSNICFQAGNYKAQIPFADVKQVRKESSALIFSNSISVERFRGDIGQPRKYWFNTGISGRDDAYKSICEMWNGAKMKVIAREGEAMGKIFYAKEEGESDRESERESEKEEDPPVTPPPTPPSTPSSSTPSSVPSTPTTPISLASTPTSTPPPSPSTPSLPSTVPIPSSASFPAHSRARTPSPTLSSFPPPFSPPPIASQGSMSLSLHSFPSWQEQSELERATTVCDFRSTPDPLHDLKSRSTVSVSPEEKASIPVSQTSPKRAMKMPPATTPRKSAPVLPPPRKRAGEEKKKEDKEKEEKENKGTDEKKGDTQEEKNQEEKETTVQEKKDKEKEGEGNDKGEKEKEPSVILPPCSPTCATISSTEFPKAPFFEKSLGMSPSKFLEVAFLRKNAYFETYSHQLEGVKNFVWGEIERRSCSYYNKNSFTQELNYSIGPSSCDMTQELTVWRPSPSQMIVFSCSYCRELPYGDCFNTEFMLQITEKPGSPDECLVKVAAYVNWIKSVWAMKGMIEKNAVPKQEKAVKEFIESLETFVKQEKPKEEEEEKEEESEEEEEEEVGEGESWREDPLPPVGSCSFLDDNQKKEIGRKPELSQDFPVSPATFYRRIYGKTSDFAQKFVLAQEGTSEPKEEAVEVRDCCFTKKNSFTKALNFSIGPSSTTVCQESYMFRTAENEFIIYNLSMTRDVPYGDCFNVETITTVKPNPSNPNSCTVTLAVWINWLKSVWAMKGMIEKGAIQGSLDGMKVFLKEVEQVIKKEDAKKSDKKTTKEKRRRAPSLSRAPPTPLLPPKRVPRLSKPYPHPPISPPISSPRPVTPKILQAFLSPSLYIMIAFLILCSHLRTETENHFDALEKWNVSNSKLEAHLELYFEYLDFVLENRENGEFQLTKDKWKDFSASTKISEQQEKWKTNLGKLKNEISETSDSVGAILDEINKAKEEQVEKQGGIFSSIFSTIMAFFFLMPYSYVGLLCVASSLTLVLCLF